MKNRDVTDVAQSAYLLEYGKRKIRVYADTFRDLARVFGEDGKRGEREAAAGETGEKEAGSRAVPDADGRAAPDADGAVRPSRTACLLKKRMEESRQLFAGNLEEMAELMEDVAEESVRFIRLGGRRQKRIIRELAEEGLTARDIYLVQRKDERMELSVMLSSRTKNSRTVQEAADYLSVLLDMRLVSAGRNPFFIGQEPVCCFFEEEPCYTYMTGAARAVKETETVSGDSYAFFEAGDGNLTAVLSDGMGSGEEACGESGAVVDMTESILEAGLPPEMAVQLINSAVAAGDGQGDRLPTLDLCSIDLYEGSCRFLKTGAAASLIKRGSSVEKITASALPLGTFGQAGMGTAERDISHGEYIVLLSDGVTGGWPEENGEEKLEKLLAGLSAASPMEISNTLLKYTIEQCRGKIRDDMTVLTVGIWQRKEREQETLTFQGKYEKM